MPANNHFDETAPKIWEQLVAIGRSAPAGTWHRSGFAIPSLFQVAAVLIAGAAFLGALYGLYRHVDGAGYERGVSVTAAAWQAREAEQTATYGRELKRLSENALLQTQKGAVDTAAAVRKLTKGTADALAQKDADIAALHNGLLVLRDPGGGPACGPAGGGTPGAVAADPAGGQPAAGGELQKPGAHVLSAEAAEFILGEAARADQVVAQLQAAQALLVSDREVCK